MWGILLKEGVLYCTKGSSLTFPTEVSRKGTVTERSTQMRRLSVLCLDRGLTSLNCPCHPAFPSEHGGRFQIKGLDLASSTQGTRAHALWWFEDVVKACFG